MRKIQQTLTSILLICLVTLSAVTANAQADAVYGWAKGYGSTGTDINRGIATDASGNVYTVGYFASSITALSLTSAGSSDIIITKHNAAGVLQWAKAMGGSSSDQGFAIAVDANSNVYITGNFNGTADFDPSASTTNLSSAGGTTDIFMAKYDASGNYVWAKSMGSSTNTDVGYGIAVDASSNVYITGYFAGTADFNPSISTANLVSVSGSQDIFMAKYDVSGNYVWAKSMGSSTADQGYGIAVDASSNVYITGQFASTVDFDPSASTVNLVTAGGNDIFMAKYNTSGNYVWAKSMGSTLSDFGNGIAVDASSNVYITGNFTGTADFDPSATTANLVSAGFADIFMAKYDVSGNYVWAKSMGSSTGNDVGFAIAVDASSNVYITGYFNGTADFDPSASTVNLVTASGNDIFMAKYNATGNYVWAKGFGSTDSDVGYSIAVDASKNVYIAGQFTGTVDFDPSASTANLVGIGGSDLFVGKYSQQVTATFTVSACNSYTWAAKANKVYTANNTTDTIHLNSVFGYDSLVTLNLTVKNSTTSSSTQTQCSGSYTWNGVTYNTSGTYTKTFTGAAGCDSTATLNLTIKNATTSTTNTTICSNQLPYSWNGSRASAGTYTYTTTNSVGCDSVATLVLTVKTTSTSTTNVSICPSALPYSWNGSRASAGTYTYTTTNSQGCDSVATLNLTVNQSPVIASAGNALNFTAYSTVAFNQPFSTATDNFTLETWVNWNGQITTQNNGWVQVLNNGGVAPNSGYGFQINTNNRKVGFVMAGIAGADCSVITPNTWYHLALVRKNGVATLFVNGVPDANVLNDAPYTPATTAQMGLFGFAGSIDEVRMWNVAKTQAEIQAAMNTTLQGNEANLAAYYNFNQGIAAGNNSADPKVLYGTANGKNGILYNFILTGATSNFVSSYSTSTQSVCLGSNATSFSPTVTGATSYQWYSNTTASNTGGSIIGAATSASYTAPTTIAGTKYYYLVANNAFGCGATTTSIQTLTVNEASTSITNVTICSSELPYSWNGLTFNEAGSQTATLNNAAGCDSLATLNLTIKQSTTSTTTQTQCGGSYSWNGVTYNTTGVYTKTFTGGNSVGCDSVATLNLFINSTTSTKTVSIALSALPYTWNGVSYSSAGVYTKTFTGENSVGCDSIATLNLLVAPQITANSQWVWMNGYDYNDAPGNNGNQGIADASNTPSTIQGSVSWTDANGNLWLFGGYGNYTGGTSVGARNDLWKYNTNTNQWTWVSGDGGIDNLGDYGTKGIAAASNKPGGRTGSVSWTDANGNLWFFGGRGYDANYSSRGFFNDLWKYNTNTNQWTWVSGDDYSNFYTIYGTKGVAAASNKPGGRQGSVSWADASGNLWLFGGYGYAAGGSFGALNDLWKFNTSTNEWVWVSGDNTANQFGIYGTKGTAAASNKPGGRQESVSWSDASGNLWLFGGDGYDASGGGYLNDLWKFNASTNQWTWVSGDNTAPNLGIYGTKGIAAATNKPGARKSSVSWIDANSNLWLFGGYGYDASVDGTLNDLWKYNISTGEWTWINGDNSTYQLSVYGTKGTAAATNKPGSRYRSVSWKDAVGNLWLFGGNSYYDDDYGIRNDLWKLGTGCSASSSTTTQTQCGGSYTWNGVTYNISGTYTKTFANGNATGCDSVAILILKVRATSTSSTPVSVCINSLPYTWNGTAYNAAGTYNKTFTNAVNCDSVATLVLTVKAISSSSTPISICSNSLPYTWNGTAYNAAGTYTKTFTNAVGCDSVATLNLTVKTTSSSTTNTTICSTQLPYSWNGLTFPAAGSKTAILTNAVGCDSLATLVLTINPAYTINASAGNNGNITNSGNSFVCSGDNSSFYFITFNTGYYIADVLIDGVSIGATWHYTFNNVTANHTIRAIFALSCSPSTSSTSYAACSSYLWNGTTYTNSGSYTAHFTNSCGLDSAATLNLTINSATTSTNSATACGSYLWNGITYTTSGTKTFNTTNSKGCDSTATLNLIINSATISTNTQTQCGGTYTWNGVTYNASGVYTKTGLINASHCDSTATLYLTINTATTSSNTASVCSNQLPYNWNGLTFTAAGSKTAHLVNSKGCDSSATLTLSVANYSAPTVSVSSSANNVCSNVNIIFTATATNEGTTPIYQWKKNGVNVGNSSSITFLGGTLANNDSVWCVLTSNSACATSPTATSTKVKMIIKATPVVSPVKSNTGAYITNLTMCNPGSSSTLYNTYLGGTWSSSNPAVATAVNGVAVGGVSSSGLLTAVSNGTTEITYSLVTASTGCSASASLTVFVDAVPTPNAIAGGSNGVCIGNSIALSNSSIVPAGGSAVWSSLAGRATVNAVSGVLTGVNAGTASIKYAITNANGCSNSTTSSITVNSFPSVPSIGYAAGTVNPQTGPAGAFCNNRTFTLLGSPTGGVWSTTNAAVVTVTIAGLTKTVGVGTGSVVYTYTNAGGCSSSRSVIGTVAACVPRGVNGGMASSEQLVASGDFTMYPNPASSFISLNVKTLIGVGTIVVTDLYGKQVKVQALSMGTNKIDVSKLSKGIYFVSTITSEGKTTKKLVVE